MHNQCDINIILASTLILAGLAGLGIALSPAALEDIADRLLRQAHALRAFYRARAEWRKEDAA